MPRQATSGGFQVTPAPRPFAARRDGVVLSGHASGDGPAVVLLHSLTGTRDCVLADLGALERSGRRVIAFDARGHGLSSCAPADGYRYEEMAADAIAVLDALGAERAALVGLSMGAATAVASALAHPERVSALVLVLVTPYSRGAPSRDPSIWDRRAAAYLAGGPEAYLAAIEPLAVGEPWRDWARGLIRDRLAAHPDRGALADAMRGIARSSPFPGPEALERIAVPTLVVASRDEADPDHPLAIAQEYARRIPGARLAVEEPGQTPLAWRSQDLAREIVAFLDASGRARPRLAAGRGGKPAPVSVEPEAAPVGALGLREGVRACLFDLDGVLTRTAVLHAAAWKEVLDAFLRERAAAPGGSYAPFTADDYAVYVDGRPRADGVRTFLASRGISLPEGAPGDPPEAETVAGLGARKNRMLLRLIEERGVEVYPGSVRFVRAARAAGMRTAVVSASTNCREVLERAGIADLFESRIDGVVAERQGLRGKPAPDTFLAGARALGVEPREAAVFEDALAGVAAGRAGHFGWVVGVDRDARADELRRHGADVVVSDLEELLPA